MKDALTCAHATRVVLPLPRKGDQATDQRIDQCAGYVTKHLSDMKICVSA
jgi:hypothetical protein